MDVKLKVSRAIGKDGEVVLRLGSSIAVLRHYGKGLYLSHYNGKIPAAFADVIIAEYENTLAAGHQLLVFVDSRITMTYEPGFRKTLTHWIREHIDQCVGFNVLTNHEIIRMGINVANMLIHGRVKAYTDQAAFEAEFRKYDPAFHGLDRFLADAKVA